LGELALTAAILVILAVLTALLATVVSLIAEFWGPGRVSSGVFKGQHADWQPITSAAARIEVQQGVSSVWDELTPVEWLH